MPAFKFQQTVVLQRKLLCLKNFITNNHSKNTIGNFIYFCPFLHVQLKDYKMKKLVLLSLLIVAATSAFSQDIQLHYDMGKQRHFLTSTVEMFKPDKHGSTFFFIDMNYGDGEFGDVQGVSLAYWEIARALKFWKSPLAIHVEYNGGFGQWKFKEAGGAYTINDAWLGGLEYSWNAKDFSRGLTLQAMFKTIRGKNKASFQTTAVWYWNLANNKISMSGFADFWKEDNIFGTAKTKFVFLSEPQFWYNFNKNFSIGSEEELGVNFTGNPTKGFHINPTIAMKYTF